LFEIEDNPKGSIARP